MIVDQTDDLVKAKAVSMVSARRTETRAGFKQGLRMKRLSMPK